MARPRKNATANDGSGTVAKSELKRARKSAPAPSRKCRPVQARRSSAFRGVTRHRWTGRFEAHLWDKDTWNHESRARAKKKKKGKQVYLGAYDDEEAAARAYDLAALKYWGPGTVLNFPLCSYDEELKEMEGQSREEYIGSVRRKSSGFSRGVSKYRGVARHHHNGRWEARIGRVLGNKYLYLGTYATQEEAAVAYDIAAIEHRGLNAVTNFDVSHYFNWYRRRRLTERARAGATTSGLNEPLAATATFHDDDGEQHHIADSYILPQLTVDDQVATRTPPAHKAPPSSPALDLLLLQSPRFMEIMEQVSAAATDRSPSPCTSSLSSASLPSQASPERRPESSGGASSSAAARCGFPDDVQTYFGSDDDGMMSFAFAEEVDTFLFGDLGSYAAPMFQCDLHAFDVDSSS